MKNLSDKLAQCQIKIKEKELEIGQCENELKSLRQTPENENM